LIRETTVLPSFLLDNPRRKSRPSLAPSHEKQCPSVVYASPNGPPPDRTWGTTLLFFFFSFSPPLFPSPRPSIHSERWNNRSHWWRPASSPLESRREELRPSFLPLPRSRFPVFSRWLGDTSRTLSDREKQPEESLPSMIPRVSSRYGRIVNSPSAILVCSRRDERDILLFFLFLLFSAVFLSRGRHQAVSPVRLAGCRRGDHSPLFFPPFRVLFFLLRGPDWRILSHSCSFFSRGVRDAH